jgi:hypothetical protein
MEEPQEKSMRQKLANQTLKAKGSSPKTTLKRQHQPTNSSMLPKWSTKEAMFNQCFTINAHHHTSRKIRSALKNQTRAATDIVNVA